MLKSLILNIYTLSHSFNLVLSIIFHFWINLNIRINVKRAALFGTNWEVFAVENYFFCNIELSENVPWFFWQGYHRRRNTRQFYCGAGCLNWKPANYINGESGEIM